MDNKLKFLVIMVLFFTIFNQNIFSYFKETFTEKDQIILMGDSMFANEDYVYYNEAVANHLLKRHYNTLSVAKDGAVIKDLDGQLSKIPERHKKKENLIFISIGGNDILKEYDKKTANKSDMKMISEIFKDYKNAVLKIQEESKMTVILLNLYYPPTMTDFFQLIDYWNEAVNIFANERGIKVLEVSKLLTKANHFEDDIEPSNKGGKILGRALYEKAYQK